MSAKIETIGKKFGRLMVFEAAGKNIHKQALWKCRCDCGTELIVPGYSLRSGHVRSCGCLKLDLLSMKTGNKHPNWKGGRHVSYSGYWRVLRRDHPLSDGKGYIFEHTIFAEQALGKPLPEKAVVHHFGDTADNSKLVICQDQEYHMLLHIRAKALAECGNASYRKCCYCREYDDPMNLYVKRQKIRGWNVYHRSCLAKYSKERKRLKSGFYERNGRL